MLITATPQQLAMFEQFDPTQLSRATEAISDSLMGMTGGQGLASAGSGFGAQTSAIAELYQEVKLFRSTKRRSAKSF
ncbi:MAG: hypothetical protein CM15mV56_320 [uncultured marine virus]|nr:MAG: hypothetical protein CM15mV56_320 [uncultured marine virus]